MQVPACLLLSSFNALLSREACAADAVMSAALGLPWVDLLFMGLGTTAFTLWVSGPSQLRYPAELWRPSQPLFKKLLCQSLP